VKQEQFDILFREKVDKLQDILSSKRNDYATEDVLSNFKRNATFAELLNIDMIRPVGYALFMVMMKLDRMCNLLFSEKEPQHESIQDTLTDLMGYTILASALLEEERSKRKKKKNAFKRLLAIIYRRINRNPRDNNEYQEYP